MTRKPHALDLSPETARDLLECIELYEREWRAVAPCPLGVSRHEYNFEARDVALAKLRGLLRFYAEKGGAV